jgi:Mn2+/Fe2+ NRAMP family transporter
MIGSRIHSKINDWKARVNGEVTPIEVELARGADVKRPDRPKLLEVLGPGLITGASDDDPSGIATYSQAGAQFGYGMAWTLLFSYPLMCAIQQISAQIGRVTGRASPETCGIHTRRACCTG